MVLLYELSKYFDKNYDINLLIYLIDTLLYIHAINKDMLYKVIGRKIKEIATIYFKKIILM